MACHEKFGPGVKSGPAGPILVGQNWSAPAKTGPIIMRTNEAPPSYCSCIAIQAAMDSSDVGDLTAEVYQYLTEGR